MVLTHNPFFVFPLFVLAGFVLLGPTGTVTAQDVLPRILLGEETDDYPEVGIVGSVRNGGFCTGTLISPTHVLTAAHCAEVIGSPTSGTFELDDQIYGTFDVLIHPDYDPITLANDIAILQLNEPVLSVEPAEIFRDPPLVGDLLFIVGFGATGTAAEGSDGTFGIKRVGVTTIDDVSETLVSWTFDDDSETNTAAGDSGGPGYLVIAGDAFVASVTSGGTEPDSILGDFAFNTRVDAYADWIDLTIAMTDQPPGVDESPTGDQDGCEGTWAQPFPFLQLLIQFLTALLDALNEANEQADEGQVEPPASDEPGPSEPPAAETPAAPGVLAADRVGSRGNRMHQRPARARRKAGR